MKKLKKQKDFSKILELEKEDITNLKLLNPNEIKGGEYGISGGSEIFCASCGCPPKNTR